VTNIWLQPGAEDEHVYQVARDLNLDIIAGGPCVLVKLGFRESFD
jgi:predicted CoA-binding protein